MMNGDLDVLYWNDEPIACLTSNSISEQLSFINTCKRTRLGATASIPLANSYSLSFEGVLAVGMGMSWDELAILHRSQEKGTWRLSGVLEIGEGFLSSLDMTASVGGFITFTGSIQGIGEIISGEHDFTVWFQNADTYVDSGNNKFVFIN
jgi:hypothetical protein